MKQVNMEKIEEIGGALVTDILCYLCFRNTIYKGLSGKSAVASNLVLLALVVVTVALDIMINYVFLRQEISDMTIMVTAFGTYTLWAYMKYLTKLYCWIIILASFVALWYVKLVYKKDLRFIRKKWRYKIKLILGLLSARSVYTYVCAVVLAVTFLKIGFLGGVVSSYEVTGTALYGDEYAMAENMDYFLLLQEENWEKLSYEKKMDVLQCVLNCEGRYLSFSKEVNLYAANLESGTLGYYDHEGSAIYININHLDDPSKEVVNTILHECYHVAEHLYVEAYRSLDINSQNSVFLMDAKTYSKELENYESGKDNYYMYYGQRIEADARAYAASNTAIVFERIEEYVNETNGTKSDLNERE